MGPGQPSANWRLRQQHPEPPSSSRPGLSSGHHQHNMAPSTSSSKMAPIPNPTGSSQAKGDDPVTILDTNDICVFAERVTSTGEKQNVVYRTPEQKSKNPERLNLDRRQLVECPYLENEMKLRLLNYQNNRLGSISALNGLPNLIFLDLYNNQIGAIANLESVPTLRVLMLGKNRIKTIENLDRLHRLDVLDLHSNRISTMQNMDHLSELRVLNLAGNSITVVERLQGLRSLTELNVRRNAITDCFDLDRLPALQRVFMSNNMIGQMESISCLFQTKSLTELALDGNPIINTSKYRPSIILRIRTLRHLDLKRITEDERRRVSELFKAEEQSRAEERRATKIEQERKDAIGDIEKKWNANLKAKAEGAAAGKFTGGRGGGRGSGTLPGYSEVEVEGGLKRLCIYGLGFNVLSNAKIQSAVEQVKMSFVSFDVAAELFNKYRTFVKLKKVIFNQCDLASFSQLDKLSALPNTVTELDLRNNPVADLAFFRSYIAHRLPRIVSVNDVQLTDSERYRASRLFSKASELRREGAEASLFASTRADRYQQVSEKYTENVLSHAIRIEERLCELNNAWPDIVEKIVKETVVGLDSVAMFASFS